jgi:hypothetical protein
MDIVSISDLLVIDIEYFVKLRSLFFVFGEDDRQNIKIELMFMQDMKKYGAIHSS